MGLYMYLHCLNCKENFFLGKFVEYREAKMDKLADFLERHIDHVLKYGGDERNRAHDFDGKDLIEMSDSE